MMICGQRGFTLLEVLVAMLILSVGLIGLVGLQLNGMANVRDAYYRSQAVVLAYDIADRMRANRQGMLNGNYDDVTGAEQGSCRSTTGCDASQLSGDDVFLWRLQVAEALPGGDAVVCVDSTADDGTSAASAGCDGSGGQYVSKIWWDDDRNPATDDERLVMVFVP